MGMKSFYESFREASELLITVPESSFNPHFHNNVEIYLIKNAKYFMSINQLNFTIDNGSIVIADSYDVHGYKMVDENVVDDCSRIIVIPYEYLSYFNKVKGDRRIKNPHVKNHKLCDKLIKFVDEHILTASTIDEKKHAVNYFLSLIISVLEFEEEKDVDSVKLIKKILSYIHKNYRENITRKSIAKELGYSEEYISRVFNAFLKTNISPTL